MAPSEADVTVQKSASTSARLLCVLQTYHFLRQFLAHWTKQCIWSENGRRFLRMCVGMHDEIFHFQIFSHFMEILKYFKTPSLKYFMKFLIFTIKWLKTFKNVIKVYDISGKYIMLFMHNNIYLPLTGLFTLLQWTWNISGNISWNISRQKIHEILYHYTRLCYGAICLPFSVIGSATTAVARQAFSVAGATWNSLPDSLRDPALSFECFRQQLKTAFFLFFLIIGAFGALGVIHEWRCAL